MAGLDPAIHAFLARSKGVDGPVKPGHDGNFELAMAISPEIHSSIGENFALINKKVFLAAGTENINTNIMLG